MEHSQLNNHLELEECSLSLMLVGGCWQKACNEGTSTPQGLAISCKRAVRHPVTMTFWGIHCQFWLWYTASLSVWTREKWHTANIFFFPSLNLVSVSYVCKICKDPGNTPVGSIQTCKGSNSCTKEKGWSIRKEFLLPYFHLHFSASHSPEYR